MSKKKAFARYANNKIVPGSLIVREKAPKVGVWKEVPADLCCDECKYDPAVTNAYVVGLFYAELEEDVCTSSDAREYGIVVCNNKLYLFDLSSSPFELAIDGYYRTISGGSILTYKVLNGEFINLLSPCA